MIKWLTKKTKTEVMEATEENSEQKAVPWWKNRRAQYGIVAGAWANVIAGGGIAIAANNPTPAEQAQTPSKIEQVKQATTHNLKVTLDLAEFSRIFACRMPPICLTGAKFRPKSAFPEFCTG